MVPANIGSHTAVALSLAGHDVLLLDDLSNSSHGVVDALRAITGRPMAFFQGDVRDTDLLTDVLSRERVEAVIHFAGLKSVGESAKIPLAYYFGNVQGAISLLQAMQAVGVKTLVFSSSATVYGEPRYMPGRQGAVVDVVYNAVGCVVGYWVVKARAKGLDYLTPGPQRP